MAISLRTAGTSLYTLSPPRSPTPPSPTLAPLLDQKVGHILVELPVRSTHLDAMITTVGKSPTRQLAALLLETVSCAPVSEHPELVIPYVLLGEHIEQMGRIRKVDVIVPGPVREQIVHLVESGHVRDRRVDVPARIQRRQVHVSFGIDRIFGWTAPSRPPIDGSVRRIGVARGVWERIVRVVTRDRNKGKYRYRTGANW